VLHQIDWFVLEIKLHLSKLFVCNLMQCAGFGK
jgi:hypothetical protein